MGLGDFVLGIGVCKHVRRLAETKPDLNEECADWVRVRAVDLLANGERRIRDRQFEDAAVDRKTSCRERV